MDCSNVFSNSSFFKIFSTEQGCAWSEKRIGDEGNSFCFSTKSEADFAALISGDNKDTADDLDLRVFTITSVVSAAVATGGGGNEVLKSSLGLLYTYFCERSSHWEPCPGWVNR